MKTSLSHLPEAKQEQINDVANAIIKLIKPAKVILFGSYAKGTYVEDKYVENGITFEYISDYDFLIIMKDDSSKEHLISDKIVNRFHFQTEINIISHTIDYVNYGLSFGQYFFTDIIKEGILLFDDGNYEFEKAKVLTLEEEKIKAKEYFNIWSIVADEFLIDGTNAYERGSYRKAAFELHQACENFYNTMLLVFTGYKPKIHSLAKLRKYTKELSIELYAIFLIPNNDSKEKRLFDLLKRGYIDARYQPDYLITKEETFSLLTKINLMKRIVSQTCQERISQFD
ncbi:HEPN domain-containing protein [Pedobacter sp. AW31-3R]|uniref:HEPN domain-containing protein n=1 Tax=Pedobacter sp. AW31-3R TaxID=3445781 RepID=UPI003F9FA55A